MTQTDHSDIRKDFNGNEEFSHDNFNVNRQDKNKEGNVFLVLNYIIMLIFISACIASFYYTQEYSHSFGVYAGVINGAIIGTVNFLYQKVTEPMVILENHKYQETYIKSFTFRLFIFKFVNTNLSLVYTIYQASNHADSEHMREVYILLIGMIFQKFAQMIGNNIILKWG